MKILLKTRCGCTQVVEVEGKVRVHCVAMFPSLGPYDPNKIISDSVPTRRFDKTGDYKGQLPIFLEVIEDQ